MKINYFLFEACQNTFVFVDLLHQLAIDSDQLIEIHDYLIQQNRDDAIILLNGVALAKNGYQVEMLVLGPDGTLGAFCGNGARVCAAYLFEYYTQYKQFFIKDEHQSYELLKYSDEIYAVQLPPINYIPSVYFQGERVQADRGYFKYEFRDKILYYADAIEPHLMLQEDLSDGVLDFLAKEINQDKDSFPLGINITAYRVESNNYLYAKTYERGAQRVTKSCGTGATCTAAFHLNGSEGIVTVVNPGGSLRVRHHNALFELRGPSFLSQSFAR